MSNEPFTETCQLLERHKIRLPREVRNRIPALHEANEKVAAVALPGHFGGIQIVFGDAPLTDVRNQVRKLIERGDATPDRSGESWTLVARHLANTWPVTFSPYKGKFTLVLPSVARDLQLVPANQGDSVLLFLCGDIFEIWKPEAWIEHEAKTRSRIEALEEEITEAEDEDAKHE